MYILYIFIFAVSSLYSVFRISSPPVPVCISSYTVSLVSELAIAILQQIHLTVSSRCIPRASHQAVCCCCCTSLALASFMLYLYPAELYLLYTRIPRLDYNTACKITILITITPFL